MKEGPLKTKWRKHAVKDGIWTKSMSPHQIPGCPDLIAVDVAASDVIRTMYRTRFHWIEAKVANSGPRVFVLGRDATFHQAMWIRTMGMLGVSAWWLILSDDKWLLFPWSCDEISREVFRRKAKKYGTPVVQLYEPEAKRSELVTPMTERLERLELEVATLFGKHTKKS